MNNYLKTAKQFSKLLDSQFSFLGFKFGLEPIIGLVPWLGDTITVLLSSYLIYIGIQMKLPRSVIVRMVANLSIDYIVSLVPIVGDAFDFFYKANDKNFKLLEKYSEVEEGKIVK